MLALTPCRHIPQSIGHSLLRLNDSFVQANTVPDYCTSAILYEDVQLHNSKSSGLGGNNYLTLCIRFVKPFSNNIIPKFTNICHYRLYKPENGILFFGKFENFTLTTLQPNEYRSFYKNILIFPASHYPLVIPKMPQI